MVRKQSGNLLLGVVIIILLVAIGLPPILQWIWQESKMTVKSAKSMRSLTLAEQCQEDLLDRMNKDLVFWNSCLNGNVPAGYRNDVVTTDVSGGTYKINLATGPEPGQVTAWVSARFATEGATLKAVFSQRYVEQPVEAPGTWWWDDIPAATPYIHWGPLRGDHWAMASVTHLARHYPRLITWGRLGWPVPVDNNPAAPNTDGLSWWAFDASANPFISGGPLIDTGYYREKAMNSQIPLVTSAGNGFLRSGLGAIPDDSAVASPPGSGYFKISENSPDQGPWEVDALNWGALIKTRIHFLRDVAGLPGYEFRSSTSVIYIIDDHGDHAGMPANTDAQVMFHEKTFIEAEAIILDGLMGKLIGAGAGVLGATIPTRANLEYQHPNGQAVWTAGSPSMSSVWSSPTRCCYPLNNVMIHAYLYSTHRIEGLTNGVDSPVIYGALNTAPGASPQAPWVRSSPMSVYYDEDLALRQVHRSTIVRRTLEIQTPSW